MLYVDRHFKAIALNLGPILLPIFTPWTCPAKFMFGKFARQMCMKTYNLLRINLNSGSIKNIHNMRGNVKYFLTLIFFHILWSFQFLFMKHRFLLNSVFSVWFSLNQLFQNFPPTKSLPFFLPPTRIYTDI